MKKPINCIGWDLFSPKKLILIMRLSTLLLFVNLACVCANGFSQHERLTLNQEKASIKDLLNEIELKSKFKFLYRDEAVENTKVSVNLTDKTINEVLDYILMNTNNSYRFLENDLIVIAPKLNVQQKISGTVTDATTGEPLIGVNVVIEGTTTGTTTDVNGRFSLDNSKPDGVLIFSYIGYNPERVSINGQAVIDVKMVPDIKKLEEIVVVGYGTQPKVTITGAISSIKSDDILKTPVANVGNALTGRLPGLITVQRSGEPGYDAAKLFIRGRATMNNSDPLVLVDGVERDFSQVDPNDIENLSVLKDASATAVYGVRGANGVILLTTKRGNAEKGTFTYSGYTGIQQATRLPDMVSSEEYAMLWNEAQRNGGATEDKLRFQPDPNNPGKLKDAANPYPMANTNWFKETMRDQALQTQHNLSYSGGSEKAKYYISGGYLNQDGLFHLTNYKRYSTRANVDVNITKNLAVALDLSGRIEDRHLPNRGSEGESGPFDLMLRADPTYPVYNPDGSYVTLGVSNPKAAVEDNGYRLQKKNIFESSLKTDLKLPWITNGLSIRGLFAFDKNYTTYKHWVPYFATKILNADGSYTASVPKNPWLEENYSQRENLSIDLSLNYSRKFGKHDVGAMILYTQSEAKESYIYASRDEYATSSIPYLFAGSTGNWKNDGRAAEYARQGYVGRVTYAFNNKYLLEGNFGYNGSENFPRNKRYGFFPSVAAGWRISEESFFKNHIEVVNDLKLRASYGTVGNDRIGSDATGSDRFLYYQTAAFGGPYLIGRKGPDVQTINFGTLPNPNVTWEVAKKLNLGFDAQLFQNKLGLRFEYFKEKRDNILGKRVLSVPSTFGAELPVENFMKVENHGFEIETNYNGKIGEFRYFIKGNLTFARNKRTFIDEPANVKPNLRQTGKPIDQYFGYINGGLYQTDEECLNLPKPIGSNPKPGDIIYRDISGPNGVPDGIIDSWDQTAIGRSSLPEEIFGITLGAQWKNFDFNVLMQGATGYNVYLSGTGAWAFAHVNGAVPHKRHLDRWTPDNRDASYPRILLEGDNQHNTLQSDYWLKSASYLRVKQIELGYTIPKKLLSALKISNLRVYVAAYNWISFDNIDDYDPEAPSGQGFVYPQQRVFNAGLTLSF